MTSERLEKAIFSVLTRTSRIVTGDSEVTVVPDSEYIHGSNLDGTEKRVITINANALNSFYGLEFREVLMELKSRTYRQIAMYMWGGKTGDIYPALRQLTAKKQELNSAGALFSHLEAARTGNIFTTKFSSGERFLTYITLKELLQRIDSSSTYCLAIYWGYKYLDRDLLQNIYNQADSLVRDDIISLVNQYMQLSLPKHINRAAEILLRLTQLLLDTSTELGTSSSLLSDSGIDDSQNASLEVKAPYPKKLSEKVQEAVKAASTSSLQSNTYKNKIEIKEDIKNNIKETQNDAKIVEELDSMEESVQQMQRMAGFSSAQVTYAEELPTEDMRKKANIVQANLEKLRLQLEPMLHRHQVAGKINTRDFLTRANPWDLDIFDFQDEGLEASGGVDWIMCLDTSGSMSGTSIELVSEAAWVIKRALDNIDNMKCGVLGFNTTNEQLYGLEERVKHESYRRFHAIGGTNPVASLEDAKAQFERSTTVNKHLVLMTDGQISNKNYVEAVLKEIRKLDVTIIFCAVGNFAMSNIDNVDIKLVYNSPEQLVTMVETMISDILKQAHLSAFRRQIR